MLQGAMNFEESKKFDFHNELRNEGEATCPCCTRLVKIYKRKLHSGMARQIIAMYRAGETHQWVHASKFATPTGTGDFAKLRHWGLVEEAPNNDEKKKTSGYWKLTAAGVDFVLCKRVVYQYIHLLDGKMQGFDGEHVNIREALGDKFNYSELMAHGR